MHCRPPALTVLQESGQKNGMRLSTVKRILVKLKNGLSCINVEIVNYCPLELSVHAHFYCNAKTHADKSLAKIIIEEYSVAAKIKPEILQNFTPFFFA